MQKNALRQGLTCQRGFPGGASGKESCLKKKKTKQNTHYQRNANQNHNEVPLHASQDGCYPKVYKQ